MNTDFSHLLEALERDTSYADYVKECDDSKRELSHQFPHVCTAKNCLADFGHLFYNVMGDINTKTKKIYPAGVSKKLTKPKYSWSRKYDTIKADNVFKEFKPEHIKCIDKQKKRSIAEAFFQFKTITEKRIKDTRDSLEKYNCEEYRNTIKINTPVEVFDVGCLKDDIRKIEKRYVSSKHTVIHGYVYMERLDDFYFNIMPVVEIDSNQYMTGKVQNTCLRTHYVTPWHKHKTKMYVFEFKTIHKHVYRINLPKVILGSEVLISYFSELEKLWSDYTKSLNYLKKHFYKELLVHGCF